MKQQNFTRHFGAHYKAELQSIQSSHFTHPDEVVAFLRKHHLLNKVLVPTQTTIAALLQDPSVDQTIKTQLLSWATQQVQEKLTIEKTQ